MAKVILINALTLTRVPLAFLFCSIFLFRLNPFFPCVSLFALVAASDYFDGKLARKYHVQTSIGAIFDVLADFIFIVAACSSLSIRGLFPGWMLGVIILKFLEFWISSSLFKRNNNNLAVFLFDPLGRIVAVLFYLLPVLVLLLQFCLTAAAGQTVLLIICAGISAMTVVSSYYRITAFLKMCGKQNEKCPAQKIGR